MQTARHFVRALIEFTAGMQHCQHHLKGALVLLLMHIHGNAAAIVHNCYRIILVYRYLDMSAKTGKRLIDRVINNFIYKMMQAFNTDITDIHGRTLTHRLQPLEHLNVARTVFLRLACVQFECFF